jgi:hypothetical protein
MKLLELTSALSKGAADIGLKAPTVKKEAVASTAAWSHRVIFVIEAITLILAFIRRRPALKIAPQ